MRKGRKPLFFSQVLRSLTVVLEHQSLPLGPRLDDPRTPTPKSRTPTPESCPIDPTSPDPDTGVQHQARLPRPPLPDPPQTKIGRPAPTL